MGVSLQGSAFRLRLSISTLLKYESMFSEGRMRTLGSRPTVMQTLNPL